MAGTVAYVSVSGLLKVFTGAGTMGLVLFTSIEVAKIIGTSAIHTYGKRIGWFYTSLLSIMIIISMAITSMGIYGFLSSSYKESFAKMETVNAHVELLESKLGGYQDQLDYVVSEKESLNITITELTKGLSNNVIQYKDPETGEIITTTSSSTRRTLEKQLDNAILRQGDVNIKADSLTTVVFDLENDILETKLSNDSANELSTLKYLADITGKTMDEVMSWFILLLIIIGDPMAVLLVIVFNKVVNPKKKKEKKDKEDPKESLTDDEIIEKGRKLKLKKIFAKVTEIGDKRREETGIDDDEEEPTALAYTPLEYDEGADLENDFVQQIQDNVKRDIPITDTVMSDAVDEAKDEFVETPVEDSLPNPLEIVEGQGKYGNNLEGEEFEIEIIEEFEVDPIEEFEEEIESEDIVNEDGSDRTEFAEGEETIVETKPRIDTQHEIILPKVEDTENTPEEQIVENVEEVKQLKREPIVPRGKIIAEDVIPRGFSVDIPDPKANRISSEDGSDNVHLFPRNRTDEIGNE